MKKRLIAATLAIALGCVYPLALPAQPPRNEQEDEVLNFLKEVNPQMAEHLQQVRAMDPGQYEQMLAGVANQYRELKRLKITHPQEAQKAIEAAKTEGQISVLANQYKQAATPQQKEELRKKIKDSLAQIFDTKIALEEARVTEIEKDLKAFKDRTTLRKQNKDKIIEKKFSELTSVENENLNW